MWRVEFDVRAAKELKKLSSDVRKRILAFLKNRIESDEDPKRFGKGLSANLAGLWRYRVDDYRIVCRICDETVVVLVLRVAHRREVY